jgi:hypothetical protein
VRDGVGARGAWGVLGLVWFLLEHITSQDSNRLRRSFILTGEALTTIPWERLLSLRGEGGGGVLGEFGQWSLGSATGDVRCCNFPVCVVMEGLVGQWFCVGGLLLQRASGE